jgi:hypothetical protein
MSELRVYDTTVPGILDSLRKGEWLVPKFQRDFVWSTDQVSALVQSILESRPIGMVTLWEQHGSNRLPIERLSITDQDPNTRLPTQILFGEDVQATKQFAVLDGRQRCTAIAMAFGGFRALHGLYRYSGRYYLDVKQADPRKRVKFTRETDARRQGLDSDNTCVGKGLFPLASNQLGETVLAQWMRYLQALKNPANYPDGVLPASDELERRNRILQSAFEGIVNTKLAVYVVPEKYSLPEICDIFETLNTTGTKVSTVDLIHSWLYADTIDDSIGPFLLRDWIADFGEKDGAIGWSSPDDRPELMAQLVTACHVALINKPAPRPGAGGRQESITSIKSSDLLATPAQHWRTVKQHEDFLAQALGAAQTTVAGGYFPWSICPYPISISIYVALRWHAQFDAAETHPWRTEELNALFRAFFWRNALTRRYDQGFLSQIGTDIAHLKAILSTRPNFVSSAEWARSAEPQLAPLFEYPVPSKTELIDLITSGNQGGAMQKALTLPMLAGARQDILDSGLTLSYPSATPVELHHIVPKEWCRNNQHGALAAILDVGVAGKDYVNAVANLMPLSRESNNAWRQRIPEQFFRERRITFEPNQENFRTIFIDKKAFQLLNEGATGIEAFWKHRADLIATHLINLTKVVF